MSGIIASMALMATAALAQSVGKAVVVNGCGYDVKLCNVPAQFGGYEEIDKTLGPNETYTQEWTELTNEAGWSIKLSPMDSTDDKILQYEYCYQGENILWYDLSEVNGNPWDANWEITASSASSTCSPKQQAYRYATDDAYGMQSCPVDSEITVTLCSGDRANDGSAASASSSVAAVSSSIATATSVSTFTTPTSSVPTFTTSTEAEPTTSSEAWSSTSSEAAPSSYENVAATSAVESSATPTTFATLTTSSSAVTSTQADGAVTVTEVATAVVTNVVTSTHYWDGHEHGHHYSARHAHPHARV